MKVILSLLIFPALNLMATTHLTDVWFRNNDNLFTNSKFIKPYIEIRSVKPVGICFGNCVEGYCHEFTTNPSANSKSIEIIEQSFEPALLTNSSKNTLADLDKILMVQLLASNNLSLARLGQRFLISSIEPEKKLNMTDLPPENSATCN